MGQRIWLQTTWQHKPTHTGAIMKLPKFLYESLPLIYLSLGNAAAKLQYGGFSAALFITACLLVHIARYQYRHAK